MKSPAVVNFSREPHSVELREFTRPEPGPEDVILAVEAVGVCGSDLHQWTSSHSWPVNYPVVLGHEFGGRIAELGAAVKGWSEGDRVVSETAAVIDANSPLTRAGLYNLEPKRKGFGYGVDGAMTRFVRVPARCLHRVPAGLAMEHAALTEPCCVAYNAVIQNARVHPGDRVIVLGPGPIGILCAAMARLAGAEVALVGLERDRARLEVGKAYGCEVIIGDATAWAKARDGLAQFLRGTRCAEQRAVGQLQHTRRQTGVQRDDRDDLVAVHVVAPEEREEFRQHLGCRRQVRDLVEKFV